MSALFIRQTLPNRKQNTGNRQPSMIDIHNHLLGEDSLTGDLNDAASRCEELAGDGVEQIIMTLHMSESQKRDAEHSRVFEHRLRKLRQALAEKTSLKLQIGTGYEWALNAELPNRLRDFAGYPTINESGYLLIGLPSLAIPPDYEKTLERILAGGYTPIVAHPECSRATRRNPEIIEQLIKLGCLIQIDALSVTGGYTQEIEIFTRELLERGQAHFIATRAGLQTRRTARLSEAAVRAGQIIGRGTARCLVSENPWSVLENATVAAACFAGSPRRGFAAALQPRS